METAHALLDDSIRVVAPTGCAEATAAWSPHATSTVLAEFLGKHARRRFRVFVRRAVSEGSPCSDSRGVGWGTRDGRVVALAAGRTSFQCRGARVRYFRARRRLVAAR